MTWFESEWVNAVLRVVQEAFQELADVNGATSVAVTFGQEAPHLQLSAKGSIGSRYLHADILEIVLFVRRFDTEGLLGQHRVAPEQCFYLVTPRLVYPQPPPRLDSALLRTRVAVCGDSQCDYRAPSFWSSHRSCPLKTRAYHFIVICCFSGAPCGSDGEI